MLNGDQIKIKRFLLFLQISKFVLPLFFFYSTENLNWNSSNNETLEHSNNRTQQNHSLDSPPQFSIDALAANSDNKNKIVRIRLIMMIIKVIRFLFKFVFV